LDEVSESDWDERLWPFILTVAARVIVAACWSPLTAKLAADSRWHTDRMDAAQSGVLTPEQVGRLRSELHPNVFARRYALQAPPPVLDMHGKCIVISAARPLALTPEEARELQEYINGRAAESDALPPRADRRAS
jgi:hypothetical protein